MWYLRLMAFLTHGGNLALLALIQIAVFAAFFYGWKRLGTGKIGAAALSYFWTGFLTLGLPLAIFMPATSILGAWWLSLAWPAWLYGHLVGVVVMPPAWLMPLMFK